MATTDRKRRTLQCLAEEFITHQALGFLTRLTIVHANDPITVQQIMPLFDHPNPMSNPDKHDILDELCLKDLVHRYAYLGSIYYQSKVVFINTTLIKGEKYEA